MWVLCALPEGRIVDVRGPGYRHTSILEGRPTQDTSAPSAEPQLKRPSPGLMVPFVLPGEPEFLGMIYERYLPIPGSKNTGICSYVEHAALAFSLSLGSKSLYPAARKFPSTAPMTILQQSAQRISDFIEHVNRHQEIIRTAGDASWTATPKTGEVAIVRAYLGDRDCGSAYLNRELAPKLRKDGWVVKFASVFLHQMPMVYGCKAGASPASLERSTQVACELGDLQTIFLYLAADKTVCKMRSVIFQAKLRAESGDYIIKHPQQRALYDECVGFEYKTIFPGKKRRLPTGPDRARALQYLFVADKPVHTHTIPAAAGAGARVQYGEHLLRLMNDATGREVMPSPDESQGWNRIVWDMIDQVAQRMTGLRPLRATKAFGPSSISSIASSPPTRGIWVRTIPRSLRTAGVFSLSSSGTGNSVSAQNRRPFCRLKFKIWLRLTTQRIWALKSFALSKRTTGFALLSQELVPSTGTNWQRKLPT